MRLATSLAAVLTASFLLLATSPAALASTHETTADLAEQSRMLAPRATKAYLMVQQGINLKTSVADVHCGQNAGRLWVWR